MPRKLLSLTFTAVLVSCGPLSDAIHGKPKDESSDLAPRMAQVWQGSQLLAANKAAVVAAAHQQGASDEHISLALACLMQESVDGTAAQRDASKDGSEGANYSAFNMNKAYLKTVGWQEGQGPDLNDDNNIGEAVKYLLAGVRQMGVKGFLNYHRGGESGYHNDQLYGCREFCDQIKSVQDYLLQHREAWTNGQRIAGDIGHV